MSRLDRLLLACFLTWFIANACNSKLPKQIQSSASAVIPVSRLYATQTLLPFTPSPIEITGPQGVRMKLVAEGPFEMGSEARVALDECRKLMTVMQCKSEWFEDETPRRTVFLDAFYMDLTEVTNAMYRGCVEAGGCSEPAEKRSFSRASYCDDPSYDDYPVIYISWDQAAEYCRWRGARLPTEAEWEKAARGVTGNIYPWGNDFRGDQANFCDVNCRNHWANRKFDDGRFDTAPVGAFPQGASPYGLLDMAGNVWEWVWDGYISDSYSRLPSENPVETESRDSRVLRGGSWYDLGYNLRTSNRDWAEPGSTLNDRGFRCALSASESTDLPFPYASVVTSTPPVPH